MASVTLPSGYSISIEGQFRAQQQASRTIGLLSVISLGLIFLVLYSRYRSGALALIIMGNVPLALVGSVVALAIAGRPGEMCSGCAPPPRILIRVDVRRVRGT